MLNEKAETPAPTSADSEWRGGSAKVVASAHIGMATGAGLYFYVSSLFVLPYVQTFGWSRGEISTGAALGLLGSLSAPLIGRAADRFGTKRVAVVFAVLMALTFIGKSQQNGSYLLFLILSAIFGMVAPGCSGLIFSRAVSGWFHKGRGRALGLMSAGASIGALLFTPVIAWMIERHGFAGGFATLACLVLAVGVPAIAWGLDDRDPAARPISRDCEATSLPAEPQPRRLGAILRSRTFIALAVAVFALNAPGAGVLTQLDPLLLHNGVEARSFLIGLFAAAVLIGRIGIGWLFDLHDARIVAVIFTCTGALGCVLLMSDMPLAAVVLAVSLVGFLQGMETDVIGYFVARHFHSSQFGTIFGILFTISLLGTGLGILGFGTLYDATASYDLPLGLAALTFVIAIAGFLCIPRRAAFDRDRDARVTSTP